MALPLAFLLECIGLFIASRILSVNLNLIMVVLVVLTSYILSYFLSESLEFLLLPVAYFLMINFFDDDCGVFKVIVLSFIALAVQKNLTYFILDPLLLS